jgi:6,7-dimethyl-8-ribityllumazine synthase
MTHEEQMEWNVHARGLTFAIVVARFHPEITGKLLAGAQEALKKAEAAAVSVFYVPGTFELPLAAKKLAPSYDGLIVLGAVVRGETPHFDFLADAATHGLQQVALETGKPIGFGVLTTHNYQQALERAGGAHGNKGFDAAMTAVEMVRFGQAS